MTGGRRSSVALVVIVMLSCDRVLRRGLERVFVWYGVFVWTSAPLQCRDVFKNSLSTSY